MGHKAFPCINIRGDHAKPRETRRPLQPVGHSSCPKISRQLHEDTRQMSWGYQSYGIVALDPCLLIWRRRVQRDRRLLYMSWITLITYTLLPFDKAFVFFFESHHQIVHPCLDKNNQYLKIIKWKAWKICWWEWGPSKWWLGFWFLWIIMSDYVRIYR